MNQIVAYIKGLLLTVVLLMIGGGLFIYSGLYPIGADVPHHQLSYWILETARDRSIARAAKSISIPEDLDSSRRLLAGGADYNDMCADCHLKPGVTETDFTIGLYPSPPSLTLTSNNSGENDALLKRQFWVIKHGIKASGMPAWGPTHDDQRIWNMVAFLQRLPDLSPAQYQIITARGASPANTAEH